MVVLLLGYNCFLIPSFPSSLLSSLKYFLSIYDLSRIVLPGGGLGAVLARPELPFWVGLMDGEQIAKRG